MALPLVSRRGARFKEGAEVKDAELGALGDVPEICFGNILGLEG